MKTNTIIQGDCVKVMSTLPDNSIDTIITDPPYNLTTPDSGFHRGKDSPFKRTAKSGGFMGMEWDGTQIAFKPETWKQALRVTKPGGTLLCFGGTRTYHRMACAVEDAGWIIKDCIMWLYGSGFPKATDISKQMDKTFGRRVVSEIKLKKKLNEIRIKKGFSKTDMNKLCGFEASNFFRIDNHLIGIFPKGKKWKKIREILGESNEIDKELHELYKEAEREIIERKPMTIGVGGNSKRLGNEKIIDKPSTLEAKLWNGWKSHGLKPAYEPIIVAMKPNDGSYANNALKHGVSGLNIDGGRIGYKDKSDITETPKQVTGYVQGVYTSDRKRGEGFIPKPMSAKGRFPANVILDEEAGKMLDEQSGEKSYGNKKGGYSYKGKQYKVDGFIKNNSPQALSNYGDKGGASRFFYCAKASKSERNMGLEGVEFERRADRKKEDGVGGENPRNRTNTSKQNHHPTVKPIKLMEYLCTLTKTPTGGIVLDPFIGSGSTAIACIKTERKYIGIEIDKEYCEIARKRIAVVQSPLL